MIDPSEQNMPNPERIAGLTRAINWMNGLRENPPGGINQELFSDITSHLIGILEHSEHRGGGIRGDGFSFKRRDDTIDVIEVQTDGQEEQGVELLEWTHLIPFRDDKFEGYPLVIRGNRKHPEEALGLEIEELEQPELDDTFIVSQYGGPACKWRFKPNGTIEQYENPDEDPEIVNIDDVPLESFLPPKEV